MKTIDTTHWKKFVIGKLMDGSNTGNILARDIQDGTGDTPYVTSSYVNNGVMAYIDASNYSLIKGHCILVGGKTFTLTYQAKDFVSNDSHNFEIHLKNNTMSSEVYLFLITAIRSALSTKYSWGDAVTKDKLLADEILLPINKNNPDAPDWAYMEEYIISAKNQVTKSIDAFYHIFDSRKIVVSTKNWQAFQLVQLFDPLLSSGDNKANKLDGGNIPLVSSGMYNNGVAKFVNIGDGVSELFPGNMLTIDMFGKSFYQEQPFYAVSHGRVNILKPKFDLTANIGKFIVSVLDATLSKKFSYEEMCNQKALGNLTILLPSTSMGKPDWVYMDNYIQQIELRAKQLLDKIA